jgi:hypothetical protein
MLYGLEATNPVGGMMKTLLAILLLIPTLSWGYTSSYHSSYSYHPVVEESYHPLNIITHPIYAYMPGNIYHNIYYAHNGVNWTASNTDESFMPSDGMMIAVGVGLLFLFIIILLLR